MHQELDLFMKLLEKNAGHRYPPPKPSDQIFQWGNEIDLFPLLRKSLRGIPFEFIRGYYWSISRSSIREFIYHFENFE